MAKMELEDLRRILVECSGGGEEFDLTGDVLDTSFEELGYDSLALMESAARITQEFGVSVPDEELAEVETPRALLALVNAGVTAAV